MAIYDIVYLYCTHEAASEKTSEKYLSQSKKDVPSSWQHVFLCHKHVTLQLFGRDTGRDTGTYGHNTGRDTGTSGHNTERDTGTKNRDTGRDTGT